MKVYIYLYCLFFYIQQYKKTNNKEFELIFFQLMSKNDLSLWNKERIQIEFLSFYDVKTKYNRKFFGFLCLI